MKQLIYIFAAAAVVATASLGSVEANAANTVETSISAAPKAEVKTVVLNCNLHCQKCVNKINDNLAFEKGVKDMKVDLKSHTITVKYDSSKTSEEKLIAALKKLGYTATVKKD